VSRSVERISKDFGQWMQLGERSDRKCAGVVPQLPANFAQVLEPEATMVRFLGKEPQGIHFSELLLGDTDFSEIAKVSVGGRAEGFFKAMCLLTGRDDEDFDQSCQQINEWLVRILGNEIKRQQHLLQRADKLWNTCSRQLSRLWFSPTPPR
jgi:hypothetical protein